MKDTMGERKKSSLMVALLRLRVVECLSAVYYIQDGRE